MRRVSTGGSTGPAVSFWIDRAASLSEWRYMTAQWGVVGYTTGDWRVVLRGRTLGSRAWAERNQLRRELRLSTFRLTPDSLPRYLAAIQRVPRPFLHAYPSSAERLARLCEAAGCEPPRFRALLLGSEGLLPAQREYLAHAYQAPVFTWYGQSEKLLLGGECSQSTNYHLFPDYGFAELIDDAGAPIVEPGVVGRLVGTGFLNTGAPMVRYETGDLASWAPRPCSCGWSGQLLSALRGRWTQDTVRSGEGAEVSVAALNLHGPEYRAVRHLQYEQIDDATVLVRVVPSAAWTEDMGVRLTDQVRLRLPRTRIQLVLVDSVEPDANGKTPLVRKRS
jgi:phenylacetate-CoA ligase